MRWFCILACTFTLVMSAAAFAAFGADKRRAVFGKRRVRERTLIALCVLMGAPGGLIGMRVFHHKTKKAPFPYLVPLLCILEVALLLTLFAF